MFHECWKRSRGSADWVIVIDIDEHLFHPDLTEVLMRYKTLGITIVPALGYQMISEEFPRPDARLCEAHPCGAPLDIDSSESVNEAGSDRTNDSTSTFGWARIRSREPSLE